MLGSLFVVGVGLLMGGVFRNTNQVNTWSSVVMLALMAPGWVGTLSPNPVVDQVLQAVPTYYLAWVLGLALAGEAAPGRVAVDLAVLAGSALVLLGLVVWSLRRVKR